MAAEKVYICRSTGRVAVVESMADFFGSDYFLTVSKMVYWRSPLTTRAEFVTELQACVDKPLSLLTRCGLGCDWEYVESFQEALEMLTNADDEGEW